MECWHTKDQVEAYVVESTRNGALLMEAICSLDIARPPCSLDYENTLVLVTLGEDNLGISIARSQIFVALDGIGRFCASSRDCETLTIV